MDKVNRRRPESLRSAFIHSITSGPADLPPAPTDEGKSLQRQSNPPKTGVNKELPPEKLEETVPTVPLEEQLAIFKTRRTLMQQLSHLIFSHYSNRCKSRDQPFSSLILFAIFPNNGTRAVKIVETCKGAISSEAIREEFMKIMRRLREASETTGYRRTDAEYYSLLELWYRGLLWYAVTHGQMPSGDRSSVGRRLWFERPLAVQPITTFEKWKDNQSVEFRKLNSKWRRFARKQLEQYMQCTKWSALHICEKSIFNGLWPYLKSMLRRLKEAQCNEEQWKSSLCLLRSLVNLLVHEGSEPHCLYFLAMSH